MALATFSTSARLADLAVCRIGLAFTLISTHPPPRERRIKQVCSDLLADGRILTFRWHVANTLYDAQSFEAVFLQQYMTEHRELPPLNHAAPTLKPANA